jgi:hypothetical protein
LVSEFWIFPHRKGGAVTRWAAAAGLVALVLGCAQGRVAPAGEKHSEDQVHFVTTVGPATGVTFTVTDRKWNASTHAILIQHTALWVELHNDGTHTVGIAPDDFALVVGEIRHPAVAANQLVHDGIPGSLGESRVARTDGLRPNILAPGQRAKGYLFFRFRPDDGDAELPIALSVSLRDGEAAVPLEELEVDLTVIR